MISVIIITRERAQLLQKCLTSVLAEARHVPLQIIVVVNGSDDATTALLEQWPEHPFEVVTLPEAVPPGAARNQGIRHVKGEWTFFLDDDAQLPSGYFDYWRKTIQALPQAQVIGGPDASPPDGEGLARAVSIALSSPLCTGATFRRHRPQGLKAQPASETILTSCNLWIRSSWWKKGISFPEDYRRGEETVVLLDIRRQTSEMWWVPGLEIYHSRRTQWAALARASWGGGFHRARVLAHKGGPKWFWFAPLFVVLHLSIVAMPPAFIFFVAVWLFSVASVSLYLCWEARRLLLWPLVIFLHWGILFSYGVGFWQYQSERS